MAGYSAVIDLRVNGLEGLRTVSDRIESINRLIKQIRPVPTLFDKRGSDELKTAKQNLDLLVKAYADGGSRSAAFSTSIAGLNQQLTTFRSVAANAKTGSDQFTNSLKAAEIASNKLANAEIKRLNTLQDLYTRKATGGLTAEDQGPSGLTKNVLALGKQLPKSIAGLRTYGAELDRVFNLVEAGSVDFRTLQAEIARVNKQLDIATGAGPIQGPIQGPKPPPTPRGGGARGGINNRLENIALGVGFPLLFGGGGGEVLGSLAGSFVGTGFGGQIFGGAIGGILDDFITKAGELGTALNPATANIEELVKALGGSTTAAGAYITKLDELKYAQEALAVSTAELERLVGVQGVEALRTFGEDSTKLQSVFTQAMTQMQASVASLINSTGILKALAEAIEYNVLLRQATSSTDPRMRDLQQQRQQAGGPTLAGGDPQKFFALNDKLVEQQRIINEEKRKQYETQTKILTAEEKTQEILKETKKLASEIKTAYQEITNEARKRIETEQASLERGQAVAQARYAAEKATLDLSTQQLERAYEYAKTQQDRYNLAIALFNNAVQTAKIEYLQQLESIAAAERKLQVELQELTLAQDRVKLKAKELELDALKERDEQTRLKLLEQIDATTNSYLSTSGQVISEVQKQLESQQLIGQYQRQTAEAQLQSKVLAAQTALEQKLVSAEIGLSNSAAIQLSNSLAAGVYRASELSTAMFNVAQQAASAAQQMQNALNLQNMLRNGGNQNGGTVPAFAAGGFVSGPTRALVGEGGAEYIIPAGKMDAAMSRYAAGQRGKDVIPGASADSSSGSGYAPSINPMINVTTGPVMNMNGSNYVSQRDFVAGLQAASRRGAQMALSAMRGNGGIRRAVGAR